MPKIVYTWPLKDLVVSSQRRRFEFSWSNLYTQDVEWEEFYYIIRESQHSQFIKLLGDPAAKPNTAHTMPWIRQLWDNPNHCKEQVIQVEWTYWKQEAVKADDFVDDVLGITWDVKQIEKLNKKIKWTIDKVNLKKESK